MPESQLDSKPLAYGKLAPPFALTASDGRRYTREQFRGKAGLLLLFFRTAPAGSPAAALLHGVAGDIAEYDELGARVFGITPDSLPDTALPFPLLRDDLHAAWRAYTGGAPDYAYAVFVLDTYGAVEGQQVAAEPDDLPGPAEILRWVQGSQFKCTV